MRVLGFVLALLAWMLASQVAWAEEGRWQALENNPDCVVWDGDPLDEERVIRVSRLWARGTSQVTLSGPQRVPESHLTPAEFNRGTEIGLARQ